MRPPRRGHDGGRVRLDDDSAAPIAPLLVDAAAKLRVQAEQHEEGDDQGQRHCPSQTRQSQEHLAERAAPLVDRAVDDAPDGLHDCHEEHQQREGQPKDQNGNGGEASQGRVHPTIVRCPIRLMESPFDTTPCAITSSELRNAGCAADPAPTDETAWFDPDWKAASVSGPGFERASLRPSRARPFGRSALPRPPPPPGR